VGPDDQAEPFEPSELAIYLAARDRPEVGDASIGEGDDVIARRRAGGNEVTDRGRLWAVHTFEHIVEKRGPRGAVSRE
jgi:hypothetical protein